MTDLKNVDVVYYSLDDLIANSSIYLPDKKENNSIFDICFLQQVKQNFIIKQVKMLAFLMH